MGLCWSIYTRKDYNMTFDRPKKRDPEKVLEPEILEYRAQMLRENIELEIAERNCAIVRDYFRRFRLYENADGTIIRKKQ